MTLLKQIGIITLGCVLAGGMALLGIWQLQVYARQGAEASASRASQPPVPLASVAPAATRVTDGYGLSVQVRGRYDPTLQVLVPAESTGPADTLGQLRVVTGLRQADGSTVAVVRGLVPEGSTAPPAPPTGEVTLTGVLLPSEEAADGPTNTASTVLPSVRVPLLAQTWPAPMVDGFVVLSEADARAGGLPAAPLLLPEGQGRLRNGAYAAQWWIFGLFAVVMSARIARDLGRQSELDTPLTLIR